MSPPSVPVRRSISKASIRRLAHDSSSQFLTQSYDGALEDLRQYVRNVVARALNATIFCDRKSITTSHITYALRSLGYYSSLPHELRQASADDFRCMRRCNFQAPAAQRKSNPFHAEISETPFNRLCREVLRDLGCPGLRFTASARHYLQLAAEQHLMSTSFNVKATQEPDVCAAPVGDLALLDTLATYLQAEDVEPAALHLQQYWNHVTMLCQLADTQTVTARVLEVASSFGSAPATTASAAQQRLAARLLRGRFGTRRITKEAVQYHAQYLAKLFGAAEEANSHSVCPEDLGKHEASLTGPA